jgi:uncharacterized membrane protein
MQTMRLVIVLAVLTGCLAPLIISGQELYEDLHGIWRAEVIEVLSSGKRVLPGTDVITTYQELRVRPMEGPRAGEDISFENDYIIQLETGDTFFLNYLVGLDGAISYSVREVDRRMSLIALFGLFAAVLLLLGGLQGIRSLLALAVNLCIILFLLLPQLLSGVPPVPLAVGYACLMLTLSMFLTHGAQRTTVIALLSTLASVAVTGVLASFAVDLAALSGFVSDESVYLNLTTRGTLDLSGLLLAAIIIGMLGLLDDVSITQVVAVSELFRAQAGIDRRRVFAHALKIGREHVGALVNTLALAYAGASLPLLLLFSLSDASPWLLLNQEVIAAEVVRTLLGSVGLMLTVPLSTYLAVRFLVPEHTEQV